MRRKGMKRMMAAALVASLVVLSACGDGGSGNSGSGESGNGSGGSGSGSGKAGGKTTFSADVQDLTKGVKAQSVSAEQKANPAATVAVTDFGLQMFQREIKAGENTLISPASVLFALGMTANGAQGDTLAQFEDTFGMSMEELNVYLYAYRQSLPNEEKCKVTTANSIWFKDKESLSVSEDFLQKNADYYAAGVYKAPFDESTRQDINNWVKDNTDGMIEEILDSIPADAVMYLVNAMAFDAKWKEPYEKNQIHEGKFTKEDGTTQDVEFMYSGEKRYLENENGTGFLKYYEGGKYAFAALLPKEGMALEDYVATLTGEKLNRMFNDPEVIEVHTAIPKFEAEYDTELANTLRAMGISDAFDPERADFSGLGESLDGNISISRVIHKTYICVDENGTKAAAATAVEAKDEAAFYEPEYREVYLNRPFVYCLNDCEEGFPIFMGCVYTVE